MNAEKHKNGAKLSSSKENIGLRSVKTSAKKYCYLTNPKSNHFLTDFETISMEGIHKLTGFDSIQFNSIYWSKET